jgi:hypothetical protein
MHHQPKQVQSISHNVLWQVLWLYAVTGTRHCVTADPKQPQSSAQQQHSATNHTTSRHVLCDVDLTADHNMQSTQNWEAQSQCSIAATTYVTQHTNQLWQRVASCVLLDLWKCCIQLMISHHCRCWHALVLLPHDCQIADCANHSLAQTGTMPV